MFGEANPFHPLGVPNPPLDEVPDGVFDLDAKPTFADSDHRLVETGGPVCKIRLCDERLPATNAQSKGFLLVGITTRGRPAAP